MIPVIEKACDKLKKDPELLGIVLFGSYARDEHHLNSDIDLIAVYAYEIDKAYTFMMDDKMIHVLARSFTAFKERLFKRGRNRPYALHGKVLYDKLGQFENILNEAKEKALEDGPVPLTNKEIFQHRITLTQDIYTIEGLIENDQFEGATFLIHEVLLCAIDLYYDFFNLYKVGQKRMIEDLKKHDEALAEACSLVILSNDIQAKLANLWLVRNQVLELVGGEVLEYEINF